MNTNEDVVKWIVTSGVIINQAIFFSNQFNISITILLISKFVFFSYILSIMYKILPV